MISVRMGSAGHLKTHPARGRDGWAADDAAVIDFRERIIVLRGQAQTFGGGELPRVVRAEIVSSGVTSR